MGEIKIQTIGSKTTVERIIFVDSIRMRDMIASIDTSILPLKERIFMTIYLMCNFVETLTITQLVDILYGFGLLPYERNGKYGNIYQCLQRLKTKRVVEEFKNPLRYKIRNNKQARSYIQYILRKRYNIIAPEEIL